MSQKFIFGKKYRSLKGSGPIFGRQTPKLGSPAARRDDQPARSADTMICERPMQKKLK